MYLYGNSGMVSIDHRRRCFLYVHLTSLAMILSPSGLTRLQFDTLTVNFKFVQDFLLRFWALPLSLPHLKKAPAPPHSFSLDYILCLSLGVTKLVPVPVPLEVMVWWCDGWGVLLTPGLYIHAELVSIEGVAILHIGAWSLVLRTSLEQLDPSWVYREVKNE